MKAKSQKYINGTFDLTLKDGRSISVSVENYKKYFKIRGRSKWDSEGDKENRTYTFKNNNVRVFYNKPDESYNGIAKSMNFYADDDGKFYIGEIIIEES